MIKILKAGIAGILTLALGLGVAACGSTNSSKNSADSTAQQSASGKDSGKEIVFGVAPGPYGDMVKLAIKPELEKKGYAIKIMEFSD